MDNKIIKTALVEWEKLKLFQPAELKKMSKIQLEKLKSSFKANGFKSPFYVWQEKEMLWCLDGHQRLPILKLLRDEGELIPNKLPANFVDCKNKKEAKKAVLIFNSHYADIQQDALADWIKDLDFEDLKLEIDIDNIDFGQIEQMLQPETNNDDEVPEDVKPITKLGDLWELGKHRVLCGDSTKIEDVERVMGGGKIDMVFTDPPYGVSYADKNKYLNSICRGNKIQIPIENDHREISELKKDVILPAFKNILNILNEYSSYYITAPQGGDLLMMMTMMQKAGLILRHMIIWNKNNHVFGRTDYNYKHEPILYGWVKKHKFYGNGSQKFSTWNFDKPLKSDLHPTMKPVELVANAILNSSQKEMFIADLFLGSGSTLIACEKTDRICYGIELDPHYCDVIRDRYIKWCKDNNREYSVKLNGKLYSEKQNKNANVKQKSSK